MAIKKKTGRGAAAAEGALAGATLGSTFAPGVGTAIGAGLGALGAGIFGGDQYAAMQQEELEELLDAQELGMLGLSDEEIATLSAESQGRVGRQKQEALGQQAKLTATADLGAKAAMVDDLETRVRFAELEQQNANQIALLDMQERMKDEARIQELTGEMSKEAQENQDRVFAAAIGMADLVKGQAEGADKDALDFEQLQANIEMAEKLQGMGISLEGMSYEELSRMAIGAAG